ncbi:MAG: restriction endonuclease subunit S [Marinagarivorans sp.]|nr:restriction endonuclease subunit S [Marinagarivorans sp.]
MSSMLPNGWSISTLNDLSSVITKGTTPTTNGFPYTKSGIKFLRVENISKSGAILEDDLKFISQEANNSLRRSQLRSGDLLISIAGAIGRTALVEERHLPANTNQAVGIVRLVEDGAEKKYIRFSIESPIVDQQIKDMQSGLAQINLNLEQLGSVRINLPPRPEQQKIAAILTSVDEVIESTQAQINKLKDLKTGMMQELLTKGIGRDGLPHTEFKDSPVGRIPREWEVVNLNSVCNLITKGTTPTTLGFSYTDSGINFIKVESIVETGVIDKGKFSYICENANKALSRSIIHAGDILITIAGATVGKLAIVEEIHTPANTNQALAIVRVDVKRVDRNLVYFWLQSGYVLREVANIQTVGAQPNLSLAQIGGLNIILPPIEEQKKIVGVFTSIDAKLKIASLKLKASQAIKKALMQDLLTGKVRVKVN